MEIFYLIIGIIIGAVAVYFILKSGQVSRVVYDELNGRFIKSETDLQNKSLKIIDLENIVSSEKEKNKIQQEDNQATKNELVRVSAEKENLQNILLEQKQTGENLKTQIAELQGVNNNYYAKISELTAINDSLKQNFDNQKKEIERLQEEAKLQFENIANKILEEKTEKFTSQNQINLKNILEPLGENLENFKKRVSEVYENEARERFSLNSTIKLMMEQTNKISQEANNLATALKGQTKVQGDWGEMILERILEDSGLTKDREYFTQYNIKNENGENQRPDFVLKLPGGQIVIIDSKVSLNAYERMISAETEDQQKQNLNLHIASLKRHIDTLAQKRYDDLKESLDFTIMFVPVEPAFLVAVQNDPHLWNYAYQKHIILLSPTNLIAYLKLISDVWKRADQNRNAEKIAQEAGALYDKFYGFIDDLISIGKKMDGTKKDYESAMNKLSTGSGNIVRRIENLKKMGASAKKSLPENLVERAMDNQIEWNDESDN